MLPLILYDIPSNVEGTYWSLNTVKSRFVLGYKGLPFKTEWIEYPDIAPRMKEIGATPNKRPDGSDIYTLPVISDPNTGAVVTDSWDIAVYLESTYPEKPIFPKDTNGLIRALDTTYADQTQPAVAFIYLRVTEILRERSVGYFIPAREKLLNRKLGEFSPEGPVRDQHWSVLEKLFTTTKMWHDTTDGKWLVGGTFSYADILVACRLYWLKKVLHDDEWKRVAAWNDGKWEMLLTDVKEECKVIP
ncbi:hypothetical protein V8B97DRAFT_1976680 [Scleroderma yunnanense]